MRAPNHVYSDGSEHDKQVGIKALDLIHFFEKEAHRPPR